MMAVQPRGGERIRPLDSTKSGMPAGEYVVLSREYRDIVNHRFGNAAPVQAVDLECGQVWPFELHEFEIVATRTTSRQE